MQNNGPIGMLFDLSFTEFVTTRIIKILFIFGVVIAAIGTIALIIGGFSGGFGKGLLFLILSPIVFFLYVILARMWCELVIVVFRIAENTGRLVDQGKKP